MNSPPGAPVGLSATVSGTSVVLKWNPPADDPTPTTGLSSNVRIGTTPGAPDLVSAPALTNGAPLVPRMGPARNGSAELAPLAPGRTYCWRVQAVDNGFAVSPFAAERQFSTSPLLVNPVYPANGVFEFDFTNRTALNFDLFASPNVAPPSTNWTNLGPATSLGGGLFRFTDAGAGGQPHRSYLLQPP